MFHKLHFNILSSVITIYLASILLPGFTLSQTTLKKIEINPLNRVMLFFDALPIDYSSELSADKKRIVLKVESSSFENAAAKMPGSGIIQLVNVEKSSTDLLITLNLAEKRGYTAVPLPYSNVIMVEVFKWDKTYSGRG